MDWLSRCSPVCRTDCSFCYDLRCQLRLHHRTNSVTCWTCIIHHLILLFREEANNIREPRGMFARRFWPLTYCSHVPKVPWDEKFNIQKHRCNMRMWNQRLNRLKKSLLTITLASIRSLLCSKFAVLRTKFTKFSRQRIINTQSRT
jgi:hypothetical protein